MINMYAVLLKLQKEGTFMKRLKLIYNPFSGNKSFKFNLDTCIEKFQNAGYCVDIFRTTKEGDIEKHVSTLKPKEYDAIVISGGDGSINILVNAVMKYNLADTPIGIIPSGTANDFASFLKLPEDIESCCNVICNGRIQNADIGYINDRYFINVCAGGLFSNVSQNIDKTFKNTLGKLAYYIKGIEQIPTFTPMKMRITNSKEVIEDTFNLFLVLNSSGTGGIENLSPTASINDGLFDFVGFRKVKVTNMMSLIYKFFTGDYLDDDRILFFKDNYIKIENLSADQTYSQTDIDGELGPKMPVEIKNIPAAIKVFY